MMWGYGQNMMGWGYGAFGFFHMIFWIIVLGVIIVAAVAWAVRTMAPSSAHQLSAPRSPGLDLLEERYARGEINRDEYLQKKRDISPQ